MSGRDESDAAKLAQPEGSPGEPDPDQRDTTAGRLATWLGFAAASVAGIYVFQLLQSADATDCYYAAIGGADTSNKDLLVSPVCEDEPWPTVRANLDANAAADIRGESRPVEMPSEIEARSDIVVWHALLAALVAAAAGLITPSMLSVKRLGGRWREVGGALLIVIAAAVVVRAIASQTRGIDLGPVEGIGLTVVGTLVTVTLLLTIPVAAGPVAIWMILRRAAPGELEELRMVGQALRWHAYALGFILTLGVLATAGRWRTVENLPGAGSLPTSLILLYGAIFAVALAALYLPADNLWLSQVDSVVLKDTGGDRFAPGASSRANELRRQLGADVTATDRARSALSILSPLVAAALSSLFG